ncbi:MAG: type II toxin-antitoxin system HicB family antitoxin [Gemmatimonadetes bacterium]|nr:type II toxin-antitoxin system HicB family antitoxin [Gemmatimonadota bacterium]MXY97737.1 type II toxin-antitoxin system HicB family antitoxin [Gemmatimonadota bacterium]
MRRLKIIVEEHVDGFVAYPLGLAGVVVGQGNTYEDALKDVTSAIEFHIESFGSEAFEDDSEVISAYVTDTELAD